MHHTVTGRGKIPLLCIHGWGCESGQFSALGEALADDFRIHCIDLPGHGRTPLDNFVPGFENYADAIAEFITREGLHDAVLLGHSMGGVLVLLTGARVAHRAIINLDGGLPPAPHTLAGQATIRSWLDLPDLRERLAEIVREGFFLPEERDEQCDTIVHGMRSAPLAVLRFLPEQIGQLDAASVLPKLTAPVLYVGTARARFDVVEAGKSQPSIKSVEISGCGHFLHIYATQKVAELVREFALK